MDDFAHGGGLSVSWQSGCVIAETNQPMTQDLFPSTTQTLKQVSEGLKTQRLCLRPSMPSMISVPQHQVPLSGHIQSPTNPHCQNCIAMNRVVRQIPAESIKNPQELLKNIEAFCKGNGYKLESLEMRNDVYVISLGWPVLAKERAEGPATDTVRNQMRDTWKLFLIRLC